MARYADGMQWKCRQEGYWYFREDGLVNLLCSVLPVIVIFTDDYWKGEAEAKKHALTRRVIAKSQAPESWPAFYLHWTPDEEIEEILNLAQRGNAEPLRRFVACSPMIVASQDNTHIIVIRRQWA
jgi:hypothetical protein